MSKSLPRKSSFQASVIEAWKQSQPSYRDWSTVRAIGIIGGGFSGIIAARRLAEEGYDVTLFDQNPRLGGVWAKGYHNLTVQTSKDCYELADFPMPAHFQNHPDQNEVLEYVDALVQDAQHRIAASGRGSLSIQVNTVVSRMHQPTPNSWMLTHGPTLGPDNAPPNVDDGHCESSLFDLVVVATGLFSKPFIPAVENREVFQGRTMHTSERLSLQTTKGKDVVIIGYGKSACDAAVDLIDCGANAAKSVTLVYRRLHWPVPLRFLDWISLEKLAFTRVFSAVLPLWLYPGPFEKSLHRFAQGRLVRLFWWSMEKIIDYQFGLSKAGMLPTTRMERDYFHADFLLPDRRLYDYIVQGRITAIHGIPMEFLRQGLSIDRGSVDTLGKDEPRMVGVQADVVIFATGWKATYSCFPEATRKALMSLDGLYLYNHMVSPHLPRMVFIGHAVTFTNTLTQMLQVEWLLGVLKHQIVIPTSEFMTKATERLKGWKRRTVPISLHRGSLIQLHGLHYHDMLLDDLGINPRVVQSNGGSLLQELTATYVPNVYAGVFERLRNRTVGAGSAGDNGKWDNADLAPTKSHSRATWTNGVLLAAVFGCGALLYSKSSLTIGENAMSVLSSLR